MQPIALDIKDLEKTYRSGAVQTPALRDVSLSLQRGSFTAIVGPSGCGKTTLLTILAGLDRADAGYAMVAGIDLVRASTRDLEEYRRHSVGIVFQSYNLLPSLTALENVESGLEFLELKASARRSRALDALAQVDLADVAKRLPAQLSGGQQQRVAIARAVAREPALLLADEPTGNLDEEAGEVVYSVLRSLVQAIGTTCVLVTHERHLAARADSVVRLRDGRVDDTENDRISGLRLRAPIDAPSGRLDPSLADLALAGTR